MSQPTEAPLGPRGQVVSPHPLRGDRLAGVEDCAKTASETHNPHSLIPGHAATATANTLSSIRPGLSRALFLVSIVIPLARPATCEGLRWMTHG